MAHLPDNSSNEEVNEFFNQEYLSKMESLEAELGALDKLLEEKATKDNKRSDFRKNVTMKAGRGLRKMLGFSEGRRDTLEKRIKEKEEEWKAIAKKYHTNNDKSNPFSMNYEEDHDKKLKKAIEDFFPLDCNFNAALKAILVARAVFPIDGRPAIIIKSD